MQFLADVFVPCDQCEGKRFKPQVLEVKYRGRGVDQVLDMTVREALTFFSSSPKVLRRLQVLDEIGLGYLRLGQPATTLSGGEAQRIKIAAHLSSNTGDRVLYILDEPTTGLHFDDIAKLLAAFKKLLAAGHSVLVVEHNLDVIKTADWIIDLGPEGGAAGGEIIAVGTPEEIAKNPNSATGRSLAPVLAGTQHRLRREHAREHAKVEKPQVSKLFAEQIRVQGARQHNLKSVDATIARDKMTVFCGPSGSGKTSLAMDTIYAEGQRRYVESLSSYARQFVSQMQKPAVDHVDGLSPAIAIEQKNLGHTPRSTVGTVTEIYDYLRILFARLGQPHCPSCEIPVGTQTSDEIVDKIMSEPDQTRLYLMAPVDIEVGEEYDRLWADVRAAGYPRIRIDGQTHSVD